MIRGEHPLQSKMSLLVYRGSDKGEDFVYEEWYADAELLFQKHEVA
jgi:hypothetical protein